MNTTDTSYVSVHHNEYAYTGAKQAVIHCHIDVTLTDGTCGIEYSNLHQSRQKNRKSQLC